MFDKAKEQPVNQPYRKVQVDGLPIIESLQKMDYNILLKDYYEEKGKPLKPVKRHAKSKTTVPSNLSCPKCRAPADYLYANNGEKGQYQCKVCACVFNQKNQYAKEAILKCPHCLKTLDKVKERKVFDPYKCKNNACSFYKRNLHGLSSKERKRFKENPQDFKMRYLFRQFRMEYKPLSKQSPKKPKVDLSRLYVSPHTLGLILTYHVNYGLSARKTAALLKDVHGLDISHQSILN
ncbi:hypothetical protein J1TS1_35680 [Shouchella clausii]|nr:hypothetical protein J1TS1_35680 [Shouchella clausii]